MITKISGQLVEKTESSVIMNVAGLCYEVLVPLSVLQRVEQNLRENNQLELMTYHYIQISPSAGFPQLVGFFNEVERDFFKQFIKVSGIGPRAAVKALNKPISEISRAIDDGDLAFLKTLPGIGAQKAKEIIAKLQGKVGKYGLIRDEKAIPPTAVRPGWQEEALVVLLQLQYKKLEAEQMMHAALERSPQINSAEDLLNEIYKQRMKR